MHRPVTKKCPCIRLGDQLLVHFLGSAISLSFSFHYKSLVLLTRLLKPHLVVYALKNKHTFKRPCSTTCVFDLVSPTVKEE